MIAWKEGIGDWVMVRDLASGKETRLAWPGRVPVQPVFSPDETLLAAGDVSDRNGLCVWRIADGKLTRNFRVGGKIDSVRV
jgi:hypothetical protein